MGPPVFSLGLFNLLFLLGLAFFFSVKSHSLVTEHFKIRSGFFGVFVCLFLLNQGLAPHSTQEPSVTGTAEGAGIPSLGAGQGLKSRCCRKAHALAQPTATWRFRI